MSTSVRAATEAATRTLRVQMNQAASRVHVTPTTWATDSPASVSDQCLLLALRLLFDSRNHYVFAARPVPSCDVEMSICLSVCHVRGFCRNE